MSPSMIGVHRIRRWSIDMKRLRSVGIFPKKIHAVARCPCRLVRSLIMPHNTCKFAQPRFSGPVRSRDSLQPRFPIWIMHPQTRPHGRATSARILTGLAMRCKSFTPNAVQMAGYRLQCPPGRSLEASDSRSAHNLPSVGPWTVEILTSSSAHVGLPRGCGSRSLAIRRRRVRNSLRVTATSAS